MPRCRIQQQNLISRGIIVPSFLRESHLLTGQSLWGGFFSFYKDHSIKKAKFLQIKAESKGKNAEETRRMYFLEFEKHFIIIPLG
jgi:hypothetical protein